MHYSGFVVPCLPWGKSGCLGFPVTTAQEAKVLCQVLASAPALTFHSRDGFYSWVLLPHSRSTPVSLSMVSLTRHPRHSVRGLSSF